MEGQVLLNFNPPCKKLLCLLRGAGHVQGVAVEDAGLTGPMDIGPHFTEGLGHRKPVIHHRLQEEICTR